MRHSETILMIIIIITVVLGVLYATKIRHTQDIHLKVKELHYRAKANNDKVDLIFTQHLEYLNAK